MLEKEFVPYEPSLALKELGFDEPHFKSYVGISNNGDIKDCTYVLCNGKLNNDTRLLVFTCKDIDIINFTDFIFQEIRKAGRELKFLFNPVPVQERYVC